MEARKKEGTDKKERIKSEKQMRGMSCGTCEQSFGACPDRARCFHSGLIFRKCKQAFIR